MIYDSLFSSEHNTVKKVALLFTIPCAILPIMMASALLITIPFEPVFFEYEYIASLAVYIIYGYGLALSWKLHKNLLPAALFLLHLGSTFTYFLFLQSEWLQYLSFIGIMAVSISNQFYRVGSVKCTVCKS